MMMGYPEKMGKVLDRMGGIYLVDDLLTAIGEGRMQSFAEGNSWAVTQVIQFPRARQLQIVAAVGDLADLDAMHDRVLDYARSEGIGLISTYGRRGWMSRALARGWKIKAKNILYHREL
jgi:hypothetical protein